MRVDYKSSGPYSLAKWKTKEDLAFLSDPKLNF